MPSRKRAGQAGPSQRQLRVGEEIRHTLADLFNRNDLRDPVLDGVSITVSEVRMSANLRSAIAFIMPLASDDRDAIVEALQRATPYLRSRIGRAVHLKYTPTLRFEIDTRFDHADKMDRLLRSLSIDDSSDPATTATRDSTEVDLDPDDDTTDPDRSPRSQ